MADEMVSKNFLEEKKFNQKKVFVQERTEDMKSREGRSTNFEELIESLTSQFDMLSFIEEDSVNQSKD